MAYSNSSLATYDNTAKHKHYTKGRTAIKGVILHHMASVSTGKSCADYFATTTKQVSANYCVGKDGDIALCVSEANRAWTTGGYNPDGYYVTIEVSNAETKNWSVSDATLKATIKLIADIYKRNGISKCIFTGKKETSNLMAHRWYDATTCPGDWLYAKFSYIADEVNNLLNPPAETTEQVTSKLTYVVQVGAFSEKKHAENYLSKLKSQGIDGIIVVKGDMDGDGKITAADARKILRKAVDLE